jgi:hypothetical protein
MAPVNSAASNAAQATPEQINNQQSALIKKQAYDTWQAIAPQTVANPAIANTVLTFQPILTGLTKKFRVKTNILFSGAASADTLAITPLGIANVFSNITFTDLYSNQRINTPGYHLFTISTVKQKFPFLSSGTAASNDNNAGYANNTDNVNTAPTSVAEGTTGNALYHTLDVPLAFNDTFLRGCIYTNVQQSSMNLRLTLNPNFFVASTADATMAVYQSSAAILGTITSLTVTVWQNYFEQLPVDRNGSVILPAIDAQTAYQLLNTAAQLPTANQQNIYLYASQRSFLSTLTLFDNGGTLNPMTDMNNFSIQVASSFSPLNLITPDIQAGVHRELLGFDMPDGMIFISHKKRPILIQQYGNVALLFNPSSVAAGSNLQINYESFQPVNQILTSGSVG